MTLSRKSAVPKSHTEIEIEELQRKFRVLENDKRAYGEEAQAQIRKQRSGVEKLTKENRLVKQDVNEQRALISSHQNALYGEKMHKLNEDCDQLQKKADTARQRKEELQQQVRFLESRIFKCREVMACMGGVNAAKETNDSVAKQIRVLENRLDKALQKFNEAVAHNKELRERIDGLRRERVVFDNIYRKMERELQDKKKEMANIIEVATSAYEARDLAQQQMLSLKGHSDKEHAEFEKEWKELGRLIENDKKLKDFMKTKEKERDNAETRKEGAAEEDAKKKKMSKPATWGAEPGQPISSERLAAYEEAFAKIQAATGIADIDELVNNFISAEDQNFSLFNYANELSGDIDRLESAILTLKGEMNQHQGGGATDQQWQGLIQDFEEKCARMEKKASQYEAKQEQTVKVLNVLTNGMKAMHSKLGCTARGEDEQGDAEGPPEPSIIEMFGEVERRACELLRVSKAMQESGEMAVSLPVPSRKPTRAASRGAAGAPMQIQLPSTVDDVSDDEGSEEDDGDTRPLSQAELRMKSLRGVGKRMEQKGRAKGKK